MALSLSNSNHSLLPPRLSPSKPSKTLTLYSLHLHRHRHRIQPFSVSCSSNTNTRSFKSSPALPDSSPYISEEEEVSQLESEADRKNLPNLKTLIKLYKQAILYGDEEKASLIEARIYSIDKEKNELIQNVAALSAEITSGKEKYIRLQADFDNFRRRLDKERLNVRDNAKGEVIESLLPMVDSFERAKQQINPETEREKKIDTSYQGIYKQFVEIMRSLQVAAVPTVGKTFDPSLHEAIAREESEEVKEGIIIQEFRRGFRLGDRLLRPAMVKVSAGPGSGSKKVPKAAKPTEQPTTAAEFQQLKDKFDRYGR